VNDFFAKLARLIRDPSVEIDVTAFVFALVISSIIAFVVSYLYRCFYENRATGSQVHRSFLLLGPSITALFIAIQFSLPLSLGLLGALSIIRFRTPIKEPEEVGFIMLMIATSVVCATFQFLLLFVLLFIAFTVLVVKKYFFSWMGDGRRDGVMLITLAASAGENAKDKIMEVLQEKIANVHLESASFAEDLTTLHYSFTDLKTINLNGVHHSLREVAPVQKINFFYNRQSTLF
jgi:hypothetical protein